MWFRLNLTPLLLATLLPVVAHAQFIWATNNGGVIITSYTGAVSEVTIPDTILGLPVTAIGDRAFYGARNILTNLTIPNSVVSIGYQAFTSCWGLTEVTIGTNVSSIGDYACSHCQSLTNLFVPSSVTNIGNWAFWECNRLIGVTLSSGVRNIGRFAFYQCPGLTSITIPNSVTNISSHAFDDCGGLTNITIGNGVLCLGETPFTYCWRLTGVYFKGDAPVGDTNVFYVANKVTVYYLPGSTGWGATFGGRPTALWRPQIQTSDDNFGVRTNQFGFNIAWAEGTTVVVDACTDLANPIWSPLQTNTLTTDTLYFSDPQWTNYPARFYRVRWP